MFHSRSNFMSAMISLAVISATGTAFTNRAEAGFLGTVDGVATSSTFNALGDSQIDSDSYNLRGGIGTIGEVSSRAEVPGAATDTHSYARAGGAFRTLLGLEASSVSGNMEGSRASTEGLTGATATWTDDFSINSPTALTLRFETFFHGIYQLAGPGEVVVNATSGGSSANFIHTMIGNTYRTSQGWDVITFTEIEPTIFEFTGLLSYESTLNSSLGSVNGTYFQSFAAVARSGNNAIAGVNGGRTAGLNAVLVVNPDGSTATPESLGLTLRFDSGLASPNIRAVPEPSSLALCGIAGLVGIGYARARRGRPIAA